MKDILKEKCRRKVIKGILFLHNNAQALRALATQKTLTYLGFQCPNHLPHSPDLALLDDYLFLDSSYIYTLKKVKGRYFLSNVEVIAAAETWLDGQPPEFLLSGLQKFEQQAKKCIELCGEYVE